MERRYQQPNCAFGRLSGDAWSALLTLSDEVIMLPLKQTR